MTAKIPKGFGDDFIVLSIDSILPTRKVSADTKASPTCRRILASIRAFGVIEPLVVFPQSGKSGHYVLLDGHLRLELVRQLGHREVLCLVATDDEAYTYNHKVNQLSPIQEHFMILRAIEHGVSEDRIAASLDVDVASIRQKRDLLKGICPEAVAQRGDPRERPRMFSGERLRLPLATATGVVLVQLIGDRPRRIDGHDRLLSRQSRSDRGEF